MKIASTTTAAQSGTALAGGAMEVDADGMGHVMLILSNMYANKELAVVREYVCNALDAHADAGQDRPVQLTLPTPMAPTLAVRDFGRGLSFDELVGVYARYGKSTKRDRDDQVGHFGIGAKAGFTVSPQITVTGIKDGQRTVILFSIDTDNTPRWDVLARDTTDEASGVKVEIAAEATNAFTDAARQVLSALTPGSVECADLTAGWLWDGVEPIAEGMWLRREGHHQNLSVVMGGVLYTISDELAGQLTQRITTWKGCDLVKGAVIEVPLGAVDLAPSRETLRNTPRTLSTLTELWAQATTRATEKAEATLNQMDGRGEQCLFISRTRRTLAGFHDDDSLRVGVFSSKDYRPSLQGVGSVLVIDDVSGEKFRPVRNRLPHWHDDLGEKPDLVILNRGSGIGWGATPAMTWEEFQKATTRRTAKSSKTGATLMYPTYTSSERTEDDVETLRELGDKVLLCRSGWRGASAGLQLIEHLDQDDLVIVIVEHPRSMAAARKRLPQARDMVKVLRPVMEHLVHTTEGLAEHLALTTARSWGLKNALMNPNNGIADPAWREAADALREQDRSPRGNDGGLMSFLAARSPNFGADARVLLADEIAQHPLNVVEARYPLLKGLSGLIGVAQARHVAEYVNAVYAARQAERALHTVAD